MQEQDHSLDFKTIIQKIFKTGQQKKTFNKYMTDVGSATKNEAK